VTFAVFQTCYSINGRLLHAADAEYEDLIMIYEDLIMIYEDLIMIYEDLIMISTKDHKWSTVWFLGSGATKNMDKLEAYSTSGP